MLVIQRLGKLWSKLESKHLNDSNGMLDHETLREDDMYWKFEEDVCELQVISLKSMDACLKMAYVLNVYNLMIKYASVKVGIPTDSSRGVFFGGVSVELGGYAFSFDDLEHGILRGNTRHPYKISKQFGADDRRAEFALEEKDPRVHFALNCGAKSCPPVKKFTAEAINEELRISAMAFCEENSIIDSEKRQLHLSKILYWYMDDFGKDVVFLWVCSLHLTILLSTDRTTSLYQLRPKMTCRGKLWNTYMARGKNSSVKCCREGG